MTNTTQATRPEYATTIYTNEQRLAIIYAALNVAYALSHVQSNDNGRAIHALATRVLVLIKYFSGDRTLDLTAEEAHIIALALTQYRLFGHADANREADDLSRVVERSLLA